MQNEKPKERSIAVAGKDNPKSLQLVLESELSYGGFRLGEYISKYTNVVEKEAPGRYLDWDSYIVKNLDDVNLWCSSAGIVYAIRFDSRCFYKGQNLIRMHIFTFLSLLDKEPWNVEVLWTPTKDENHGQNQHVYSFNLNRSGSKGMQVWTWRKRIVSVVVYDSSFQD